MYTRALTKIAKDFGAETVNVLYTSFPYARDDKYDDLWNSTTHKRKANLANLAVSDIIHDGNRYCITLDLHNPATFNRSDWTRFVNLGTWRAFEEILQREWLVKSNVVLSWCDEWSLKKIRKTAQDLSMKHVITLKEKDYSQDQEVEDIIVLGDVAWKDVILYDDILDTGGTFCKTIEKIHEKNPRTIVWFVSHLLLNNDAQSKLDALYASWKLHKLYVTNTVLKKDLPSYIEIIDTSSLFANTIVSIENNQSIDYNFRF
jgi:ribose-phosphate pyrophosphokinase